MILQEILARPLLLVINEESDFSEGKALGDPVMIFIAVLFILLIVSTIGLYFRDRERKKLRDLLEEQENNKSDLKV